MSIQYYYSVLAGGGGVPADWYDAAWAHRLPIALDGATGTNANFPVLLTEANLGAHFFSNVKADGSDIVVTAADGLTKLDRDLVSISTGSSTLELYVRIPSLTSASEIYLYYGNAAGAESNATATYNSNILLFFPNGYSGNRTATSATDSVTGIVSTTGKVGGGGLFDGVNDLNTNVLTSFAPANWSILCWMNADSFASPFRIVGRSGSAESIGFDAAGTFAKETTTFGLSSSFTALTWEMLSVVNNASGSTGIIYKDKTSVYSSTQIDNGTLSPFDIGRGSNGAYFPGKLDHLMMMNSLASSSFISSMYDNTNDPSTFYTVSTREDL